MEGDKAEKVKIQKELEAIQRDIEQQRKKVQNGREEIEELKRRIDELDRQTLEVAAKRIQRHWRAKMARRKAREAMPPTPPVTALSPETTRKPVRIPTGECRWRARGTSKWSHMTSSEVHHQSSSPGCPGSSNIVFTLEGLTPKTEYEAHTRWVRSVCEHALDNDGIHAPLCEWGAPINFNTATSD